MDEQLPAPGPRAGRRDNGLAAATWAALGEVDPRQASALLAALAEAGIAAYTTPSTGSVGAYLSVTLPERPVDRLHVDASRRAEAADLVRAELDGPLPALDGAGDGADDADEEARAFAAIVAHWDDVPSTPVQPWPVSEDLDAPPVPPVQQVVIRPAQPVPAAPQPEPAHDTRAADDADDEGHYMPPPPPPLPRLPVATLVLVGCVLGGIAVLAFTSLVQSEPSQLLQLLGVAGVLGGAAGLIARMRDRGGDTDDGWDDGAVV